MTPTEQIEVILLDYLGQNRARIAAERIAAAGVRKGGLGAFPEDDPRPGAFHAAAGVGDKSKYCGPLPEPELPAGHGPWNDIMNATIERCAQVADKFANEEDEAYAIISREIAAAIRALKDKP